MYVPTRMYVCKTNYYYFLQKKLLKSTYAIKWNPCFSDHFQDRYYATLIGL